MSMQVFFIYLLIDIFAAAIISIKVLLMIASLSRSFASARIEERKLRLILLIRRISLFNFVSRVLFLIELCYYIVQ